jgi:hypothetical protein
MGRRPTAFPAAPALCGIDRAELQTIVWDWQTAAATLCGARAQRLDALVAAAGIASREQMRDAWRELARAVPPGHEVDLVVCGRVCAVRGDGRGAQEALSRWREAMKSLGVLH